MLLPLIVSCFSKIQIVFTFLVPAHLGSPRQRPVKRMCAKSSGLEETSARCCLPKQVHKKTNQSSWTRKTTKTTTEDSNDIFLSKYAQKYTITNKKCRTSRRPQQVVGFDPDIADSDGTVDGGQHERQEWQRLIKAQPAMNCSAIQLEWNKSNH